MSTESSILAITPESEQTGATLDGFSEAASRAEGVALKTLTRLDCVEVRTRNSVYTLNILDPLRSTALVSGGAFFPVPREAVISGASLGGSMLKVGMVLLGFQCEILSGGERIVTTRVRNIRVNAAGATAGPF